jgi:hypothetical protein
MALKRIAAVKVKGRADPLGDRFYGNPLAIQFAVLVREIVHDGSEIFLSRSCSDYFNFSTDVFFS